MSHFSSVGVCILFLNKDNQWRVWLYRSLFPVVWAMVLIVPLVMVSYFSMEEPLLSERWIVIDKASISTILLICSYRVHVRLPFVYDAGFMVKLRI